jgi:leukotriene-A4 hydrolase
MLISLSKQVSAPSELTVLMSALREGEPVKNGDKTVYSFRQPVPIPSYLLAIVAGDLQSRQIGPRSHVWAEPDVLDQAAFEFAEVFEEKNSMFQFSNVTLI